MTDITERKQQEVERAHLTEELRESEGHYRSLFERVPIGLFRTTPAGQILDVNPASVQMFGYPDRDSLLAVNVTNLYANPEVRKQLRALLEREGVVRDFEVQGQRRDGTIIWVRLNMRAVRDSKGRTLYDGSIEDITERKRAEEALRQSEARYRTVSDLISDYVYAVRIEPDGRTVVEWVTEAFQRMTGFTVQELAAGGGIVRVIHPDDMPSVRQRLSVLLSGQPGVSEHRIITKSGEVRWLRDYSCPEWDPIQSRVVRIIGAGQDITERKQAVEALRESEERYRNLFENANDGIATFALDGTLTSVNRELEAMLGWSQKEMIGQQHSKFATPASVALAEECTRRALAGERLPSIFELELVRRDGSVVPVEARARFIRDQEGKPIGFQGIFRDISVKKELEQQRTEFLAMLTHDIKNPLAAILGYTEILLEEVGKHDAAEEEGILQRLRSNVLTVHSLVTNYLDPPKIEAGHLTLR